jgi:hypothetical protein
MTLNKNNKFLSIFLLTKIIRRIERIKKIKGSEFTKVS